MLRLIVLLLLASCTAQQPLALPQVDGAKSMLLVYSDPAHEREGIFAVDLEDAVLSPFALEEQDRFFALTYPLTLSELGLTRGKIEIVTDEPDRPLPTGYSVFEAPAPDRTTVEIENDVFLEFMGNVRLRGLASPMCEERGGCFRLVAGDEYCDLPCALPTVASPMPPGPPLVPSFAPCPAGWSESVGACAPPAIAGCGAGEAQLLGDEGCTSIGGPCTARFPSGLSGTVAYVDPEIAGPGSGTENDPYSQLSSALTSSADSIALAEGTHVSSALIDRDLEIAGACGEATISGSLTVAATVTLRNLTIAGPVPVTVDGALTLRNVELDGTTYAANIRTGSTLTADTVLIQQGSRGILSGGAVLSLAKIRIMGGVGPALYVRGGQATVSDLFVSDRVTSGGQRGTGIQIDSGGVVTGERIFVAATAASGIAVSGSRSSATLTDVVVRDPPNLWLSKHGVEVRDNGFAALTELLVTDTGEVGVYVSAGTAEITRAVFSDTGRPALFVRGATGMLAAEGVQIDRPRAFGARALAGELSLTDVSIEGVQRSRISIEGEQMNYDGYGVYAEQPANISLSKVEVLGALGIGVALYSPQGADLKDITVKNIERRDSLRARGITLFNTAGTLDRTRIENVDGIGLDIYAVDQKTVRTNDLSIANVTGSGFTPSVVTIEGARVDIDGAVDHAIFFDRAVVTYSDARFANTTNGMGAFVGTSDNMDYRESFFRLERARFENHPQGTCLSLGWYGTIEANETLVTGCAVGFHVVVLEEGRDRVPEGIRFFRNTLNVKVASDG